MAFWGSTGSWLNHSLCLIALYLFIYFTVKKSQNLQPPVYPGGHQAGRQHDRKGARVLVDTQLNMSQLNISVPLLLRRLMVYLAALSKVLPAGQER